MSDALDLSPISQKDLICTSLLLRSDIERIYAVARELKRGREVHTSVLRN